MALQKCLFVILLAITPFASAEEPQLGQSWQSIVQGLQSQGLQSIGDFDIKTFKQQAEQIRWVKVSPDQISEISEGRKSAYFMVREKEVFISSEIPKDADPAALELHEALGATGYNDRSYNLSSSLVTLAKGQNEGAQTGLVQGLGATVFTKNQMFSSGSGSSVGGGGDLIALTAKNKFIELMLQDSRWHDPATLAYLMQINFEPFYDPSQQFVAFRYLTNAGKDVFFAPLVPDEIPGVVASSRSGLQEQITFYIPALLWQSQPSQRAAMLAKVVTYARHLIPVAAKNFPGKTISYACGGRQLNFLPDPEKDTLAMIQKSRIAVLSGCEQASVLLELRHPQFSDYRGDELTKKVLPKNEEGLLVQGRCVFTLNGKTFAEYKPLFHKGQPEYTILSAHFDDQRDLMGIVWVNEQGLISQLAMKTYGSKTKRHFEKQFTLSQPSSRATMKMSMSSLGIEPQFTCENDLGKDL